MREDTNLYDFPCSYSFRSYEEYQNTGRELPSLIPSKIDCVFSGVCRRCGIECLDCERQNEGSDRMVDAAHKRLNRLYSRIAKLENSGKLMNGEALLEVKGEVAYLRKKVNEILDRKPKGEFF